MIVSRRSVSPLPLRSCGFASRERMRFAGTPYSGAVVDDLGSWLRSTGGEFIADLHGSGRRFTGFASQLASKGPLRRTMAALSTAANVTQPRYGASNHDA